MAVAKPINNIRNEAPPTDAREASNNDARKPQDNKAANQSPRETRAAVNNVFGDAPMMPVNQAKLSVTASKETAAPSKSVPADGNAPNHAADAGKAPAQSKSGQEESTSPSGQAHGDPKSAAPDGPKYPLGFPPGEPGKQAKDKYGNPVKTEDGNEVVVDEYRNPVPVDAGGKVIADAKGNPYVVDSKGKYVQPKAGKYAVYDKNSGRMIVFDPVSGDVVKDAKGNTYALDLNGKYMQPEQGVYGVYVDGMLVAANEDGNLAGMKPGTYVGSDVRKAAALDENGKYMKTENGEPVGYDTSIGKPVAFNPRTRDMITDGAGNPLAVGQNGKYFKTPDGRTIVYDKDNEGKLAFIDPVTGKIAKDGSGNPYTIAPDGTYARTEDGNHVVYSKAYGNKPVAIDNKTGQTIADGKGNPIALDSYGKYLKTSAGNTVVYATINGKVATVATDKSGNPFVFGGMPSVVATDGNFLKNPDGNHIVVNKQGNPVSVNQEGKLATDGDGNPLAVGEDGKYMPNAEGKLAVYDPQGRTVMPAGTCPSGLNIYKDAKTGGLETILPSGAIYQIDPLTNDVARDANGNILAPLYDPLTEDPARPPVRQNENPETTIKNIPQSKGHEDPMKIKDQLFDENGILDVNKIYEAAANYDIREIYMALINGSKNGSMKNLPANLGDGARIAYPNSQQAKEAIAAIIAWQNENGKYHPFTLGQMPAVIFYAGGKNTFQGYAINGNTYLSVDHGGDNIANVIFHELNHIAVSKGFVDAYSIGGGVKDAHYETVTEYLANNWTGKSDDTGYELWRYPQAFQLLEEAVMKMGNGDRNTGLDMLKRAYFAGDLAALEELKKYFPPGLQIAAAE